MTATLVILGSCGGARETYWIVRERSPDAHIAFVDDLNDLTSLEIHGRRYPVIKDWDFRNLCHTLCPGVPGAFTTFLPGMGYARAKRVMVEKALAHGLKPAEPLVSVHAIVRPDLRVGVGSVIHPQSFISTNVTLGDFVTVHAARMGHDVSIGRFSSVTPGCNIAGHTVLGDEVFLGAGTVVRERLHIANRVMTGMQACVVRSIETPGCVVTGVPAVPVEPAPSS